MCWIPVIASQGNTWTRVHIGPLSHPGSVCREALFHLLLVDTVVAMYSFFPEVGWLSKSLKCRHPSILTHSGESGTDDLIAQFYPPLVG